MNHQNNHNQDEAIKLSAWAALEEARQSGHLLPCGVCREALSEFASVGVFLPEGAPPYTYALCSICAPMIEGRYGDDVRERAIYETCLTFAAFKAMNEGLI